MVIKAIFWDRDGIVNDLVNHNGQYTAPWCLSEFKFKPDIKKALETTASMGYLNCIVTNQPDVKDGKLPEKHLELMTKMILNWLPIDEIGIALERNTSYYKPNNQLILDIYDRYPIDVSKSFMVGDTWKDIVCGYRSELNTIFVGSEYTAPKEYQHIKPNNMVNTALEAVYLIQEIENYD